LQAIASRRYRRRGRLHGKRFHGGNTHFADGALLPTAGNDGLFVLIGTTYGGDGENNFALPDLREAAPNSTGGSPVSYLICIDGVFPSPS